MTALNKALDLDPDFAPLEKGVPDQAIQDLNHTLLVYPNDPQLCTKRAEAHLHTNNCVAARS